MSDDFLSFMTNNVLPLRPAHPDRLRLDGQRCGGNRTEFGRFRWREKKWVVNSDTHLEPLLLAYQAVQGPFRRGVDSRWTLLPGSYLPGSYRPNEHHRTSTCTSIRLEDDGRSPTQRCNGQTSSVAPLRGLPALAAERKRSQNPDCWRTRSLYFRGGAPCVREVVASA